MSTTIFLKSGQDNGNILSMPIPTYFTQIERILQRYAKTTLLIDSNIDLAHRTGNQGFL